MRQPKVNQAEHEQISSSFNVLYIVTWTSWVDGLKI